MEFPSDENRFPKNLDDRTAELVHGQPDSAGEPFPETDPHSHTFFFKSKVKSERYLDFFNQYDIGFQQRQQRDLDRQDSSSGSDKADFGEQPLDYSPELGDQLEKKQKDLPSFEFHPSTTDEKSYFAITADDLNESETSGVLDLLDLWQTERFTLTRSMYNNLASLLDA